MIKLKNSQWEIDKIDTVLFDKDGTFIDLHYFWGKMTELRVNEIIKQYRLSNDVFKGLCLKLGYDIESKKMLSDGITALYSRSVIIEIFCKDLNNIGINITQKIWKQYLMKSILLFIKTCTNTPNLLNQL